MSVASLLVLAACGGGATAPEDGGGVTDLTIVDGGIDAPAMPDAGPGVGSPCASDSDCPGGGCLSSPGGYCTQPCEPDGGAPTCPTGASCVPLSPLVGGGECFRTCDPAATTRECRAGYGCDGLCLPGCTDDTDCPAGRSCDRTSTFITPAGSCFNPTASPGGACTTDVDCASHEHCGTEETLRWPGGACLGNGCDIATDDGCAGSCIPRPEFETRPSNSTSCAALCTTDADCRSAYSCQPVLGAPGRRYCAPHCTSDADCTVAGFVCNLAIGTCGPRFDPATLGQACEAPCPGCACLTERDRGFPGGYCACAGCTTPGAACDASVGGVCVANPPVVGDTSPGYCMAACTIDTDCRPGYACRPSTTDPTSLHACFPHCTSSSQCLMGPPGGTLSCDTACGLCVGGGFATCH